ncbi:MAG TPA: MBL fold metallo-hydrolase [Burkholderiales bacterium]|nr:MBL fold metallo-hydrolase [Burkholderiales bacterium]
MRFASLGSGSQGNGLVVERGTTRVLLDCGFGLNETVSRLSRLGLSPEDLDGIVVTHEHEDHIGGAARVARRYAIPVWLTYGTLAGLEELFAGIDTRIIENYAAFAIGDLELEPFPVPHDAREPAQFVFGDGVRRLGVLTDAGESTRHIERVLSGCNALVLECNHDRDLLQAGDYPRALKERIAGRYGHLDNSAAAALLGRLDRSRLACVVAAHLSQQNNHPQLARAALARVLGCEPDCIHVADQSAGLDWIAVE